MNNLSGHLEKSRGKIRAYFGGIELGMLAGMPQINGSYAAKRFTFFDDNSLVRTGEGIPELNAEISLYSYAIERSLHLLSGEFPLSGSLELHWPDGMLLTFPCSRLLPEWEIEPFQTGNHRIKLKFFAVSDSKGKLFYLSGA